MNMSNPLDEPHAFTSHKRHVWYIAPACARGKLEFRMGVGVQRKEKNKDFSANPWKSALSNCITFSMIPKSLSLY